MLRTFGGKKNTDVEVSEMGSRVQEGVCLEHGHLNFDHNHPLVPQQCPQPLRSDSCVQKQE